MSSLFAPPEAHFRHVSPTLAKVRLTGTAISGLVFTSPFIALAIWLSPWFWIGTAVMLVLHIWPAILINRQVKATQYALGENELFIRTGIMFKHITVIPYGRIQFVDLAEGPIARKFGMADIKINTASASTDATIPGVPTAEAVALRTYLAERGEAEKAAL